MLASEFLTKIKNLKTEDLADVKGLGEVLLKNLTEFTSSERFNVIEFKFRALEAKKLGLNINLNKINTAGLPLSGEVICITGSFDKPRSELQKMLEIKGAKVVDSVTKSTTLLLVGSDSGSKLEKAQKLGIKIETDYSNLI